MNIRSGTILNDRYEILAEIGEGGFASVYLGRDKQLGRDVAIKVMKSAFMGEDLARFQQEAKILAQLSQQNIVSVFAFGLLDDSTPFIVLEYLKGKSLRSRLNESDKLDYVEVCTILRQCCAGLSFAHESAIVHRDLSPNNIFLVQEPDLTVKLLDFGLSKLLLGESNLTATGLLMGNPPYMSPELARGEKVDRRCDIYALGCILYECLSGKAAFAADSQIAIIYLQQNEYPPEPTTSFDDPLKELLLKGIVLRCLQKDPARRFQSCQEIIEALSGKNSAPEQLTHDLQGWSNQENGSTQRRVKRSKVLLPVLLCLLACICLFQDSILALTVKGIISLREPAFVGAELPFARFLLKCRKQSMAKDLFIHSASVYASMGRFLPALECQISAAEICLQQGDKQAAVYLLSRQSKNLKAISDSKQKAMLLLRAWRLTDSARDKGGDLSRLLLLENELLSQMLDSKYLDRIELSPCFSSILRLSADIENIDDGSLKLTLETLNAFMRKTRIMTTDQDRGFIGKLMDLCRERGKFLEEAEILTRTRLFVRASSGESKSELSYELCRVIEYKSPDQAIAGLESIIDDADSGILEKALAWERTAMICVKQKNYERALRSCEQGLSVMSNTRISAVTKISIVITKIRVLFLLGRRPEAERESAALVKDLQEEATETSGIQDAVTAEVIAEDAKVNEFYVYQIDRWLPTLECLLNTEQYALAEKILEGMCVRMRANHLPVNARISKQLRVWAQDFSRLKPLIDAVLKANQQSSARN